MIDKGKEERITRPETKEERGLKGIKRGRGKEEILTRKIYRGRYSERSGKMSNNKGRAGKTKRRGK